MDVLRRIRRRQDRCAHRTTITVQSTGIERVVCDACGHVSVHFLSGLTGDLDRDRFARPIEREGKHQRGDEDPDPESLVDVFSDAGSGVLVHDPNTSPWWVEPDRDGD